MLEGVDHPPCWLTIARSTLAEEFAARAQFRDMSSSRAFQQGLWVPMRFFVVFRVRRYERVSGLYGKLTGRGGMSGLSNVSCMMGQRTLLRIAQYVLAVQGSREKFTTCRLHGYRRAMTIRRKKCITDL